MSRVILVNPNNRVPLAAAAVEPPLWLSLMASHYLEDGKDISILDAEAENLTLQETADRILLSKAEEVILVVMGNNPSVSSTPKMTTAVKLADLLKPHFDQLYLTGLHPMAVRPEGYKVLDWHPTKCLSLNWNLLPMHLYRAHNWHCLGGIDRTPYASIYTSLGCPFDCYYCNIHTLYESHQMMYRGIPNIIQEIDKLVNQYNIKNIKIWDELFALKESRVNTICSALKGYDLNMWAYARVDTVTKLMLENMKAAGINWVAYGFENADGDVRKASNKKFGDDYIEWAIKATREVGINIIGNFTFGLPGETVESAKRTIAFAKEHLFEFVNFYAALPYPGSKWYEDAKPNASWQEYDQYGESQNPWLTFKNKAFKEYFSNPAYLDMVKKKFGESGLNEINQMRKHAIGG